MTLSVRLAPESGPSGRPIRVAQIITKLLAGAGSITPRCACARLESLRRDDSCAGRGHPQLASGGGRCSDASAAAHGPRSRRAVGLAGVPNSSKCWGTLGMTSCTRTAPRRERWGGWPPTGWGSRPWFTRSMGSDSTTSSHRHAGAPTSPSSGAWLASRTNSSPTARGPLRRRSG